MSQRAQLACSVPGYWQPWLVGDDIEREDTAGGAIFLEELVSRCAGSNGPQGRTRFVPLCRDQMDSLLSSLSPRLYGKELPLAIADATADFRKSISWDTKAIVMQLKEKCNKVKLIPSQKGSLTLEHR